MHNPIIYQHHRGECSILFESFKYYQKKIPQNSVFIIDKNVYALYQNTFDNLHKPIFIYHASEKRKTLISLESILTFFYENSVDRNYFIVVVGGGITCDVGAMAASIWKRGCKLVLVPTTILAMVDAAIGGKTSINFHSIKNSVGTFYHPDTILIDTTFLQTLPIEVYLEGIPEIVKHAISLNKNLLHRLIEINNLPSGYWKNIDEEIIYENITTKLNIVISDPEEKNKRKILNLGHTVGHAIELNYGLSHGTAVANGIILELEALALMGYIEDSTLLSISKSLLKPFISKKIKNCIDPLVPYITQDKKRDNLTISIPVIKSIGNTVIETVLLSDFIAALQKVLLSNER